MQPIVSHGELNHGYCIAQRSWHQKTGKFQNMIWALYDTITGYFQSRVKWKLENKKIRRWEIIILITDYTDCTYKFTGIYW